MWHWGYVGYLARELDAEIVVVPYPLAPTNNALEVMPVLLEVYKAFKDRAGDNEIIVAGDRYVNSFASTQLFRHHAHLWSILRRRLRIRWYNSAGGQIALGLAFASHDAGVPLPDQLLVISPGLTLHMPNREAMLAIEPKSLMLTVEYCAKAVRLWAGVPVPAEIERAGKIWAIPIPEEKANNPYINPSAGDVGILREAGTQVIFVSGEWDVLHADAGPFVERLEKEGVDVTYIVGEHQLHCFPIALDASPECREAADMIVTVIKENGRDTGGETKFVVRG